MKTWRMAMRVGKDGTSMLPICSKYGVAAITYKSVSKVDLSSVSKEKFEELSKDLAIPQRVSLRRLAFEMKGGDVIYVKEGKKICKHAFLTVC